MITKWKVFNFKSIRNETELDLLPLTIFAGTNSSGKSTFIQSILLIAQTLAHKVSSRSVVLNGSLVRLGQFDDLKSNGSEADQISIKFICKPLSETDASTSRGSLKFPSNAIYYDRQIKEVACEIAFDANKTGIKKELSQIQPRLFSCQLTSFSRDKENVDQKSQITIRQATKQLFEIKGLNSIEQTDEQVRDALNYDIDFDDKSFADVKEKFISAELLGCIMKHFLPDRIILGIDKIMEDANTITKFLQEEHRLLIPRRRLVRDIVLTEPIVNILHDLLNELIDFEEVFFKEPHQQTLFEEKRTISFHVWEDTIRSLPREKRMEVRQVLNETIDLYEKIYSALKKDIEDSDPSLIVDYRLPRSIMESVWYLDEFFSSSLKYLGPLRDAPKPLYPLSQAEDPYDVGLRGEHTAAILELHKNKKIEYIPSSNFKIPNIDRRISIRTLESAVIDWLQYLGVASSVESKDKGKLGHELKVSITKAGQSHDLTHVGVGVSQVLPILVTCLLADSDSTLIFEQPELHLHPKVQTLLGDFFLSMALCNKQCIVETHSEYLIDRLRFRTAASSMTSSIAPVLKVYFVENKDESSSFREVVINEYGAIKDWPEGFFDQSQQQAEEIVRAATMKRKKNAEKKNGKCND